MKRLIKYADKYKNDNGEFSNCSTPYEVLPVLVPNEASESDLELLALDLGYEVKESAKQLSSKKWGRKLEITHNLKIGTTKVDQGCYLKGDEEERSEYLGFITIPEGGTLEPVEDLSGKVTSEDLSEIINSQEYGFSDIAELHGDKVLVITDWDAFHALAVLGYGHFNDFLEDHGMDSSAFDDSVSYCHHCGTWDHNDDGYRYNFRVIDCELVGINCGCAKEAMKNNLDEYINNSDSPIERDVAEELEEEGAIEKLETFIGGMVDGRGGYINGESVREGQPKEVLEEFKNKHPNTDFVFVIEDTGQFQTYFSICKVA